MPYKVFICYRRDDQDFARSIELQLAKEFSSKEIFMDVDSIGGGRNWKEKVLEVLDDNPVVVTLITTAWNAQEGEKPRLKHKEDHIRFELREALDRHLPIIPVLHERAEWPEAEELPRGLHPILDFQRVPISQERWKYDTGELSKALHDVLGEPRAVEPTPSPGATDVPPITPTLRPPNLVSQQPSLYSRSMFQETPEQREERLRLWREQQEAEKKRREHARLEMVPFYSRWEFWAAAFVTVLAGVAAMVGAELLVQGTYALIGAAADRWSWVPDAGFTDASILAAVLLVALWAIARISLGAAMYWYDPEEGAKVFFTRGLFGGWMLAVEDWEPLGYWAAWPIATVVGWALARVVAWIPFALWDWSYALIFWIALAIYTLPVLGFYLLLSSEEVV